MRIKLLIITLIISALTIGCTKPENIDIDNYKEQINDLNEEVINYLDELEEISKTISELEETIEKKSNIIDELINEVEILNKKIIKNSSNEILLELSEIEPEKTEGEIVETEEIENKSEVTIEKKETEAKTEQIIETINDSVNIEKDLTTVFFEESFFGILDEENVIPLKKIGFNNVLEEKILSPLKGDQYSYHRKISRDGIVIDMYSKGDKLYIIKGIFLESSEFQLKSGFGVGAKKNILEEYVKVNGIELKSYNDGIYESYSYNINNSTSVYFEIDKNIISSIKIECNY